MNNENNYRLVNIDCCVSCIWYDTEPKECNQTRKKVASNGLCDNFTKYEGEI